MLTPGARIDRYIVEHRLGQGGMAAVYAVRHAVLGTRHAVKVLHSTDPAVRERLVREGRLQAHLDAAFVVPVTDVVDVGGSPALVMPLVDGCALDELLRQHRPTEAETAALFSSMAAGVASAHAAAVIHRDIKPANVLLDERLGRVQVRVADFGLARSLDSDHTRTRSGVLMGTPAYAAPEQLRDAASADERADLWSLGVVLYELLAGRRPFVADSLAALIARVNEADFDDTGIPARWIGLLDALLEPDRALRWSSAAELVDAVQQVTQPAALVVGTPIATAVRAVRDGRPVPQPSTTAGPGAAETAFTPTRTPLPRRRHSVPAERDRFVGRSAALTALAGLVDDGARLVTVTGTGGSGKTRLVVHYARTQLEAWPGGVWFCELANARSEQAVVAAVAQGMDVPLGQKDGAVQLRHAMAGRGRSLIVLDNFEQVVQYAATTVGQWFDAAAEAVFIVTSRERLNQPGERVFELDTLAPADAVALFETRGRAAKSGWSMTPSERESITSLVDLLDRLPLAIELAAARLGVMSPRTLLSRVGERFRLLSSRARRDRHATLRATLDWSWDLLDDAERDGLAQLSVFEGGFSLHAAEGVLRCADAWGIDIVQALVEKSLLRVVDDERFELLVSVQAYAADKLDDDGAAAVRHGTVYAEFGTREAIAALDHHGGGELRVALARDLGNLAAACRRAAERGDGSVAVATFAASLQALSLTGPAARGVALADAVAAIPNVPAEAASRATVLRGWALDMGGRAADARRCFDKAVALARDRGNGWVEAEALRRIGHLHRRAGQIGESVQALDASVALFEAIDDRASLGIALGNLALVHAQSGDRGQARVLYRRALALHREMGSRMCEGVTVGNVGLVDIVDGKYDDARGNLEQALRIAVEVGDRHSQARTLGNLALLAQEEGDLTGALAHLRRARRIFAEIGHRTSAGISIGAQGNIARLLGDRAAARDHLEQAMSIHDAPSLPSAQAYWLFGLTMLDVADGALDSALERANHAVRIAKPFRSAAATAWVGLAIVQCELGNLGAARDAIAQARNLGEVGSTAAMIAAADAVVSVAEGDVDHAKAALAEATASPRHAAPLTEAGVFVAQARAALAELRAPGRDTP